jgi:putative hydrolase of the HAD superfamily
MTGRLHLVLDADDTLWENAALFDAVIADFVDWVAHPQLDAAGIRRVLLDVERMNVAAHGYGTRVFTRSLHDAVEQLRGGPVTDADRAELLALVRRIEEAEIELLDGVAETVEQLAARHDLVLMTKGDPAEQQVKIEASGLAHHFRETHVVREKDPDTYRALVRTAGLAPERTWMVGNSPRSDVLPALAAGLGAVHIPHHTMWALEEAEIPAQTPRVLRLARFADLLAHF